MLDRNQLIRETDEVFKKLIERDPYDERITLLKKLMLDDGFDFKGIVYSISNLSSPELNDKIISEFLKGVKRRGPIEIGKIRERQVVRGRDKNNAAIVNEFWQIYYEQILNELTINQHNKLTFISVGCGSGLKETDLQIQISERYPLLEINWIGMDSCDYVSEKSVFRKKGTYINIPKNFGGNYVDLTRTRLSDCIWIIANFSVHHMVLDPKDFISKCEGAKRTIMLELLVTKEKYKDIYYRIVNVGYDLISNIMINNDWARLFLSGKSNFKIDYWTVEDSQQDFTVWEFPLPHSQRYMLIKVLD